MPFGVGAASRYRGTLLLNGRRRGHRKAGEQRLFAAALVSDLTGNRAIVQVVNLLLAATQFAIAIIAFGAVVPHVRQAALDFLMVGIAGADNDEVGDYGRLPNVVLVTSNDRSRLDELLTSADFNDAHDILAFRGIESDDAVFPTAVILVGGVEPFWLESVKRCVLSEFFTAAVDNRAVRRFHGDFQLENGTRFGEVATFEIEVEPKFLAESFVQLGKDGWFENAKGLSVDAGDVCHTLVYRTGGFFGYP
jgi:hypothetical protein